MTDQAGKPKSKSLRIIAIVIVVLLGTCAYKMNERHKQVAYLDLQTNRSIAAKGISLEQYRISIWRSADTAGNAAENAKIDAYIRALAKVKQLDEQIDIMSAAIRETKSGLANKDHLKGELLVLETQFDDAWADVLRMRSEQSKEMSDAIRPAGDAFQGTGKD
jgi:hypothetical protein